MAKVEVLKEYCKGCGLCVTACPKMVLEIGENTNKKGYKYIRSKNEDCIGCKFCAMMCPDAAIEVLK